MLNISTCSRFFSLLYYHFITAFILPHFSKKAQLLLDLFRQTETLANASVFLCMNFTKQLMKYRQFY